ncbi:MAG: hypothetical protein MRY79_08840 [Alphaproteobacteria bacterium]|nr:hypothetical protein [Alphaproteobacteria bacterium]
MKHLKGALVVAFGAAVVTAACHFGLDYLFSDYTKFEGLRNLAGGTSPENFSMYMNIHNAGIFGIGAGAGYLVAKLSR